MCGRYCVDAEEQGELLRLIAGSEQIRNLPADGSVSVKTGEVFPSEIAAVIANSRNRKPCAYAMRWGFSRAGQGALLINARSETAAEKPMFAESAQLRRCLIPMSRYFEWEKRGGERIKYALAPQGGKTYLCGLYRMEQGADLPSFVVLTRPAAAELQFLHDRMPLMADAAHAAAWLSPERAYGELLCDAVERVDCREERKGAD